MRRPGFGKNSSPPPPALDFRESFHSHATLLNLPKFLRWLSFCQTGMINTNNAMQLEALKNFPLFQNLPAEALAEFSRLCVERAFGKNEMIYFKGETQGRTFFLISGEVRLYRSQAGEKVVIQVLNSGEIFGDFSFVGHPSALLSENYAQTTQSAKVCVVMSSDLAKLLARFPVLAMVMLVTLRNRLHQTESKIKDLALSTARTRIINELIRYAASHGKEDGEFYQIEDKLTHQQLGEMTGLTRETVTKTLNFLEKEGFISYMSDRTLRLNKNKILKDCLDCIQLAKAM